MRNPMLGRVYYTLTFGSYDIVRHIWADSALDHLRWDSGAVFLYREDAAHYRRYLLRAY